MKLVNPANKRKFEIIVVGSGLAGASAAASLGELGYQVTLLTFHDSPRRAHSIAAQGGINAAKNYKNDGDSVHRLFYDTVKGGDYRAREANVHRLAEVSVDIIDQCAAQGVPFAREYGGLLDNRSFGGAQVSRTFYARGQTGQQLLLGAYSALMRQVHLGSVKLYRRTEMLELVLHDGRATGVVTRDLVTGEIRSFTGHAVVLATGGYGNVFYLSTNAKASNATATWRAHRKGALFANPCFTQIHPTCIPASDEFQSKLTLMSESLRNDGRVWVPKEFGDDRTADKIPEADRDYFLERRYPTFGNLVPRDVASRAIKREGRRRPGVGSLKNGVYLDFAESIERLGPKAVEERYSNLFEMYERITDESPEKVPMRIYPAVHYTMGGLWVDYDLMSNVPGLFVLGEANFSDHGANRLGASALMQGLADGYFVLPYTIGNYLAPLRLCGPVAHRRPRLRRGGVDAYANEIKRLLSTKGTHSVDWFHRELGKIAVGQLRHGPQHRDPREGARRDPDAAGAVPHRRAGARRQRVDEPVTREGRTGVRLPRVRRVTVPRRAAPRRELRRSLPRRAPDRRRRGPPRRRELRVRRGAWEFTGVGSAAHAAQGTARVRERAPRPAQLQVEGSGSHAPQAARLAPGRSERTRRLRVVRHARRERRDVVPRAHRRAQRAPHH